MCFSLLAVDERRTWKRGNPSRTLCMSIMGIALLLLLLLLITLDQEAVIFVEDMRQTKPRFPPTRPLKRPTLVHYTHRSYHTVLLPSYKPSSINYHLIYVTCTLISRGPTSAAFPLPRDVPRPLGLTNFIMPYIMTIISNDNNTTRKRKNLQ